MNGILRFIDMVYMWNVATRRTVTSELFLVLVVYTSVDKMWLK
jgi:hypothetical protein